MPEYPDVTVYVERARERLQGQVLRQVQLLNPFVLRTAVPPIVQAQGRAVTSMQNLGKRVVLALAGDWYLVIRQMIAGRLRWLAPQAKPPGKLTLARLNFDSGQLVLTEWTQRLPVASPGWPEKVTAFHPQMAVHGRYKLPCPVCQTPVQRIVHAQSETNYCARCQTGGRLLADRALSTLLKKSWPNTVDDL